MTRDNPGRSRKRPEGSIPAGSIREGSIGAASMWMPLRRALAQLDDPAFRTVVLHSLSWAVLLLFILGWLAFHGAAWLPGHWLHTGHWGGWDWLAGVAGALAVTVLGLWLFVPISAVIGGLYADRVAFCVDRRWYPGWAEAHPAAVWPQIWDGLALGARVLAVSIVTLPLVLFLPGIGLGLGWAVSAWALGEGLFVSVAMRRMGRPAAQAMYRRLRGPVLVQGGILAAIALIPGINLLLPALGPAVMVHVLARAAFSGGTD